MQCKSKWSNNRLIYDLPKKRHVIDIQIVKNFPILLQSNQFGLSISSVKFHLNNIVYNIFDMLCSVNQVPISIEFHSKSKPNSRCQPTIASSHHQSLTGIVLLGLNAILKKNRTIVMMDDTFGFYYTHFGMVMNILVQKLRTFIYCY